jgi:hypothetical protein
MSDQNNQEPADLSLLYNHKAAEKPCIIHKTLAL